MLNILLFINMFIQVINCFTIKTPVLLNINYFLLGANLTLVLLNINYFLLGANLTLVLLNIIDEKN